MEAAASLRPRAVTVIGWVWLVAATLRFLNALVGLLVWKVGGIDRMPFLRFGAEGMRVQIGGMEIFMRHAASILLAQIVIAGVVAWAAFELLRMKPWARRAIQAAAGLGILLSLGIAAYIYTATARMAGLEGVDADEARRGGIAAAALITLLGSTCFGFTIWILGRPSVRRAFETASLTPAS